MIDGLPRIVSAALLYLVAGNVPVERTPHIGVPPPAFEVDPFYAKRLDATGIPIIASAKVPDAALITARSIVVEMLEHRPDLAACVQLPPPRVSGRHWIEALDSTPRVMGICAGWGIEVTIRADHAARRRGAHDRGNEQGRIIVTILVSPATACFSSSDQTNFASATGRAATPGATLTA